MPVKAKLTYFLLSLIVLFAIFLRINAALHTEVNIPIRADAVEYYSYAYNMNTHGVYSRDSSFDPVDTPAPDALRSPGYPLMLIPFTSEPPNQRAVLNIKLLQAILGVFTVALTFYVASSVMPKSWALFPTFLAAIAPRLISSETYVLTEAFFTFLVTASALLSCKHFSTQKLGWAFALGVFIGLAALTRPTLQYYLIAYILMIYFLFEKNKSRHIGILILGFALSYLPWLLRNLISLGYLTDPTLAINTIHHGMYPGMMYNNLPESYGIPYRFDPDSSSYTQSVTSVLNEVFHRFMRDPLTYLKWYFFDKPFTFYSWSIIAGMGDIFIFPTKQSPYFYSPVFIYTRYFMFTTYFAWLALAMTATIWTLIDLFRPRATGVQVIAPLVMLVIYFTLVHMAGFPLPRYAIPLQPVLYVLAIYTIYRAADLIGRWNTKPSGTS